MRADPLQPICNADAAVNRWSGIWGATGDGTFFTTPRARSNCLPRQAQRKHPGLPQSVAAAPGGDRGHAGLLSVPAGQTNTALAV
jgi:hypothetical protein